MPAPAGGLTGGGGSGPSHLIPLQQAAGGSQFDPGLVCAMHPLHPPASAPGGAGQQFAPDAASALFLPVRLVGLMNWMLPECDSVAAVWSIQWQASVC